MASIVLFIDKSKKKNGNRAVYINEKQIYI